jgi:hypothetical protein
MDSGSAPHVCCHYGTLICTLCTLLYWKIYDLLKRTTQDFSIDHQEIDLLRLRSFTLGKKLSDEEILGAKGMDRVAQLISCIEPFVSPPRPSSVGFKVSSRSQRLRGHQKATLRYVHKTSLREYEDATLSLTMRWQCSTLASPTAALPKSRWRGAPFVLGWIEGRTHGWTRR